MTTIGIVVLDTGYSGTNQDVSVYHYDFVPKEDPFPGIRAGYTPRPDGSDSVPGGHGTQICDKIATAIRNYRVPMPFKVISLKIGDSGNPLIGPTSVAIDPALEYLCTLPNRYPNWRFVAYLNWEMPAIEGVLSFFNRLSQIGVPLVVPAGNNSINGDLLTSPTVGGLIADWLPKYPGVLVAGNLSPDSNYGTKTVHLSVDGPDTTFAAATAAMWLATSRHGYPNHSVGAVVGRVKSLVTANPACKGKTETGGVLTGPPR